MSVRQILKRSEAIVGLIRDLRKVSALITRKIFRSDRRLVRRYFETHETRKLLLGAGPTKLHGWLGTDITPKGHGIVYLDATREFPFCDASFDFIFAEHMIEHISWEQGAFMLRECKRVLKPGGTVRIATPDLEVLVGLYTNRQNPDGERYVKWVTDTYLKDIGVYKTCFVINNAFRNWGHQFLYDGDVLALAMRGAGFTNVRRCFAGESSDENLRGIESHGANISDHDMNRFETMVFEGDVPA